MGKIVVITDSCASLPADYAAQHNVHIIPLYLLVNGKTLRDGVDITPDEFYELLPKASPLPTTSQPSVGDFVEAYSALVAAGATDILSVHIAAGVSGTVNSAVQAAKEISGARIEIIDSKCAVAAEIVIVEAAVNAIGRGAGMDEVVAAAHNAVERQRTVFTVDTLEYLYKGGRIGGATALVGSLLQFKPLLHFVDGKIAALERQRTTARAMRRLVELQSEWVGKTEPQRAIIMQAACPERAAELSALIQQEMNIADVLIVPLSPTIGTHAGNGTLGLMCCPMSAL